MIASRSLRSNRIESGARLTTDKIARPLLATLRHPRAMNFGGGDLVKLCNPIPRLRLSALAEHGNGD